MAMILTQTEQKERAAIHAVHALLAEGLLFPGMKIGLGTGSTVAPAIQEIARLAQSGALAGIKAAATSFQTEILCEELGIPVYSLNSQQLGGSLDAAIDGADEIDPQNRLIKGGGAALLREKIVAYSAKRFVVVADETKAVASLGAAFPLPVEVVAEARVSVAAQLAETGASCVLREGVRKCGPVITDSGNMILDCRWQSPVDPAEYEALINAIAGTVENGFFTRRPPLVFIGKADGSVEARGSA
jgi:ribose 5-phosphate isomerase A